MEKNKRYSILIVDDNSKNLQLLADMLRENNFRIATANHAEKALKFVHRKPIDLILLDILMPDMDGIALCRKLKQNEYTREIPVIFISALTETKDVIHGFEAGGVDYITKPFNKEEVLVRVNSQLELKNALEELKESNRIKDKMFSVISHDLRGPIGTIMNLLEIHAKNPDDISPARHREVLSRIYSTTKETYYLLENLLSWAKSHQNKMLFRPNMILVKDTVNAAMRLFAEEAENKSIALEVDADESLSAYADREMLFMIIRNLVSNAVKFTPARGKVNVCATGEEQMVRISVSDTGVGISVENMKKMFRKDVLFSTYGTNNEKGSGLGLHLCKEFIEKHGGEIRVESEEGLGTTFYFSLPTGPPAAADAFPER